MAEVIEEWPTEFSDRFVELYAENAVVASVTRQTYEEPVLEADDYRGFLGNLAAFVKCWKHR